MSDPGNGISGAELDAFPEDSLDWFAARMKRRQETIRAAASHAPGTGPRVEVRAGPFRGLRGVVEGAGLRDRVIVRVEVLGRAVALEIETSMLDVIE